MATDHIFVGTSDGLYKIDKSDGSTVASVSNGAGYNALGESPNGYIYAADDNNVVYKYDLSLNEQWSKSHFYVPKDLLVAPDENRFYVSTNDGVFAFDTSDGSEVWVNRSTGRSQFVTTDSSYSAVYFGDYSSGVYKIDKSDGSIVWNRTFSNYGNIWSGFIDPNTDDLLFGDFSQGHEFRYNLDNTQVWHNYGSVVGSSRTTGSINNSGEYLHGGIDGGIAIMSIDDGTILHETTLSEGIREAKFHPNGGVYVVTSNTLKKFDSSLNEQWSKSLSGFGKYVTAWPEYDTHQTQWLPKYSGRATLGGSGVGGATVYCIRTDTDEIVGTDTTDSNGNWSIRAPGSVGLHFAAQYTDGSGNEYNSPSKPYIN